MRKSNAHIVALVQGETSTGLLQPIKEVGKLVKEYGAIFLVDAVTSFGGTELNVDEWGIDICYSCTQKCLSSPPGLSPITVSERALERIRNRKGKARSFYFDFALLEEYWVKNMTYHHTPPVSLIYALREALRIVEEEGLEKVFERHRRNMKLLVQGLEEIGLKMHVEPEYRLPPLTTVVVPEGIDEAKVRRRLLEKFNIEIGGGLGVLRGKVWRIGLMGMNSSEDNVNLLLASLKEVLKEARSFS